MARGASSGYVFAMKDPRLTREGKPDIVYVGNGRRPWESVARHLRDSSNPEVLEWATGLFQDFPEGLEVLGQEVCDRFHGENVPVTPLTPGRTRLEWEILALEDDDQSADSWRQETHGSHQVIAPGTRKQTLIRQLREQGHPILNRGAGRPKVGSS